ncbi:MAG: tyrosine-type recombinase/integrase [Desulfovibrio sp.]|nr:tyrosine-type recombinase/integrase [Desulfovibrio sp.]
MHGLRHVFASTLSSNGVDLYTLQALLTHGSPAMTQRYVHLTNEHLRNATNVANSLAKKDEEK